MKATRSVPPTYERRATLDLSKPPLIVVALSLVSLLLFALASVLVLWVLPLLRPGLEQIGFSVTGVAGLLQYGLIGLALVALTIILHEAIHGALFWRFTGSRPLFGFRGLNAYAAAPGWYLPRNQHVAVALMPLLLITLVGMPLLALVPDVAVLPIVLVVALNIGGAVGDMLAVLWLLREDDAALVNDTGDAITVYRKKGSAIGWRSQ